MTQTIVYSNTQEPYQSWQPSHVIVLSFEGNAPRFHWIPCNLWERAYEEASNLLKQYQQKGNRGEHSLVTCRFTTQLTQAIYQVLRSLDLSLRVEVSFPPIEESHFRIFTLLRS